MKKLFFIMFLTFFVCNSYSSPDTTKYVTNSNAEKLADKYIDKVSAAITSLAQELKQPAEHIYRILIKQQIVMGVSSVLFIIVSIASLLFSIKGLNNYNKNHKEEYLSDNEGWIVLTIITGASLIASIIILFTYGLSALINPEYGVIKEIIGAIK